MTIVYPRKCEACEGVYTNRQSYSKHLRLSTCQRSQRKYLPTNTTIPKIEVKQQNREVQLDETLKKVKQLERELQFLKIDVYSMEEYVYLIQTSGYVCKDNIYKVGRTQKRIKRLDGYEKGYRIYLFVRVKNSYRIEDAMIKQFNHKFTNQPEIGREYFKGDLSEMRQSFMHVVHCYDDE